MKIRSRKRLGLILRVFARTPGVVARNAEDVLSAARKAEDLKDSQGNIFSSILILVCADTTRVDCDCGDTAAYLRKQVGVGGAIEVHEVAHGDLSCGVLNYGVATMLRDRIDYVAILSHGVAGYLTRSTMERCITALEKGARVVGVAINELQDQILEGRIANTFAVWDAKALMSVGGFDLRAAWPKKNDPTSLYLRGWNVEKGEVFYPRAGVEEIIPAIRLAQDYGPCIAAFVPEGAPIWKRPDPALDPVGHDREVKKMGTKLERQMAMALSVGADLSVLRGGLMKGSW